jgi:SAM-dependent methyltransferase
MNSRISYSIVKKNIQMQGLKLSAMGGREKSIAVMLIEKLKLKNILDIGAGDRDLKSMLPRVCTYKSMDTDKTQKHDYYSLNEIKCTFDCVVMLEVIEHMEVKKSIESLKKIKKLLKANGILIISTPNTYTLYYSDIFHKHFYPATDLVSILSLLGYKPFFVVRAAGKNFFAQFLRRVLSKITLPLFFYDLCPTIIIACRRQ